MFKKASAIVLALCMIAVFAVTASAREEFYVSTGDGDQITAWVVDISDLKAGDSASITFTADGFGGETEGYRVRLNTSTIDAAEYSDWCDGAGGDDPATGSLPALIQQGEGTFTVSFTVTDEDKWNNANTLWVVGWYGSQSFDLSNMSFNLATPTPPANDNTNEAPPATNNITAVSEDEKGGGETGLAPIAAVIGIAAVATTGVIVSVRKRK